MEIPVFSSGFFHRLIPMRRKRYESSDVMTVVIRLLIVFLDHYLVERRTRM